MAAGDRHLTPADLAERLGGDISVETLRDWRKTRRGPRYIRGDSAGDKATILYRLKDVEAWEEQHVIDPAASAGRLYRLRSTA